MTGARPLELLQQALAAAGTDLTARELAEAVWLADRLPPAGPADGPEPATGMSDRSEPRAADTDPNPLPPAPYRGTDVYTSAGGAPDGTAALPVLVPDGQALPGHAALIRALRPLRRTELSRRDGDLDERATADLAAETGLLDPVLRPRPERRHELVLVVDDGLSMQLWRELAAELRAVLARSGAFRRLRCHGLDSRHPDSPRLRSRPFAADAPTVPSAAVRPSGDRGLVLVLSDTVGAHWRGGGVGRLLADWARHCPTAVLQPLPQRLWAGAGLRTEAKVLRAVVPGGPNASWRVIDPLLPAGLAPFDGLPVPVLELSPAALAGWASFLADGGELAVRAAEVPGPVGVPAAPAPGVPALDMRSRLAGFRAAASPEAFLLASHLAAVRPLTLPVMRLVQRAVLRGRSSPAQLAEVLLGGLLRREPGPVGPERYDFRPGLRELMLETLPARAAIGTAALVTGLLRDGGQTSRYVPVLRAATAGTLALPPGATAFAGSDTPLFRHFAPVAAAGGAIEDVEIGTLAAADQALAELVAARQWQRAVERGEQVLEELLNTLGPGHPAVLGGRYDLAGWIGEAGSPQTALRLTRELLAECTARLGADHPRVLALRVGAAHWTGRSGDPVGAVAGYREVLPEQERLFGPEHPDCLYSRHQWAFWLSYGGESEKALERYRDLLPRQLTTLGAEHRETLRTRANIASHTGLTGHPAEALELWRALLPDLRRVLGPDELLSLVTEAEIAHWGAVVTGDPGEAVRRIAPLLPRLTEGFGPSHPSLYAHRRRMAVATGELGDVEGAVRLLRELLVDLSRWVPPDHGEFLATRAEHAYWTAMAGDLPAGSRQLRELLPEIEGLLGAGNLYARAARSALEELEELERSG
ncbi:SAV_2336 N-terminal domain-related protein [Kitasatospora sp. YST-16]|uniref:SAV_2336 N-terminal domain-related protein n=1 Tax=Kitasatospora sp. YST-16 TaxID=2998080 RepID=UPI00228531E6|nr:SAV_2336 N-terminal domain-related protein [Kitasatospora sp. YST-16]WAL73366.1 SAV_2336 N-terminal domain-related protein [Kitasatospora sp. YST-16]WNW39422.1 SAV_2336 N-terminal domain-related protein [Streptomyces sp. Li-HN-5-13]